MGSRVTVHRSVSLFTQLKIHMILQQQDSYLVYARKSDEGTDKQKNSIAYQVKECLRYAEQAKLKIAPVNIDGFVENGIVKERHTAFKTEGITVANDGSIRYQIARPKFQRLVQALSQKQFKGVIALCWDRISRNDQDGMIVKKFIKDGIDVRFVWVNYSKSSSGLLHIDIDGMFASHYSRVISERVRAGNAKARSEGKCLGFAPVGYLDGGSDSKPLDPERAPIVKRMFELYATGEWSVVQLSKWAHQQGLRSKPRRATRTTEEMLEGGDNNSPKASRPLSKSGVCLILSNPFYIGKLNHRGSTLNGMHQPLIDVALFNKVQEILDEHNHSVQYVDRDFYRYRGLAKCRCGRFYTPYTKKGHTYYRSSCLEHCDNPHSNLAETVMDGAVERLLGELKLTKEDCSAIDKTIRQETARHVLREDATRDDLSRQRDRIQGDLAYLKQQKVTLLRTGAYTAESYQQDFKRLNAELGQVEGRLDRKEPGNGDIHDCQGNRIFDGR
jgi:site-specific DNA recombinase